MRAYEERIASCRNRFEPLMEPKLCFEHSENMSKKKSLEIEQLTKVTKGLLCSMNSA